MVFSSHIFLVAFLPAVLIGFYGLRQCRAYNASVSFLLAASIVFYAYWSVWHLALLIGSIIVNYALGRLAAAASHETSARTAMYVGILFNLSLIFVFKYLDFAGTNLAALIGADWTVRNIILPLGISFFTFQQIAYLVDCRQTGESERSLRDYGLFVAFFPQLIAGPIVHHKVTRPQFAALARGPLNLEMAPYGAMIFAMGLVKKTLIADPIARAIDPIYAIAGAETLTSAASALAMIGYSLQIYFDFSGYCDMAIGLGLMLGIRLPINFNSPYKSKSIIEFWRRWHITLSNFLRDYVYIPLGGNRRGQVFRLRNIFLTMLIGGVWHGAAWTFIIWGALHAAVITANHAARIYLPALDRWEGMSSAFVKRTATLIFVMIAWVFFRAESAQDALAVFAGFANLGGASVDPAVVVLIVAASAIALFAPNSLEIAGYEENTERAFPRRESVSRELAGRILRPTPVSAMATAIMIAGGLAVAWKPAIFIYFNF